MTRILLILSLFVVQLSLAQGLTTDDYQKEEVYITMRDGTRLHTTIYSPKENPTELPILLTRTPYSCRPYGKEMPSQIMYNEDMVADGYIFVCQDMRGRWMSEGNWENTRPPYSFKDEDATDEVTDTYDTIDWLLENVDGHNGAVGMYGNSYVGWTPLVGAVSRHPNLKAILAMAPVTNFFFEDFNRYGLFGLSYVPVLDVFGLDHEGPTAEPWYSVHPEVFTFDTDPVTTYDYYDFFLERGTLSNFTDLISEDNFFWENIKAHPTYDAYRQERNWLQYLEDINCATLIVGGWNDEQNLWGIVHAYKAIESQSKGTDNRWIMGPWSHGHPAHRSDQYYLGDIYYGDKVSEQYQVKMEAPFFAHHLKGEAYHGLPEVKLYDTGKNAWKDLDRYPEDAQKLTLYPSADGSLLSEIGDADARMEYVSDPAHPVPFIEELDFHLMAPKPYMCDDQRFCSKRPDVLTFSTDPLTEPVTVLGEIEALLQFATDHEDADLYVKLIDVYPMDREPLKTDVEGVKMNGYQQLVRMGYLRGRFRESFEKPSPFTPGEKTEVRVELTDAFHTFKKGHRIMIQVQSSMFPLYDRNPQNYVESIYEAEESDFEKATHTLFGDSRFILPVLSD
ncbi:MAG: CocE/NonD family hydrolase [Flavobacteriales bacterium]|nr:CocE/NonD family hydrolase [Flavobacteriales bacterium]